MLTPNQKDNVHWNTDKIVINKKLIDLTVDRNKTGYLSHREKDHISQLIEELLDSIDDMHSSIEGEKK